MIQVRGSDQKRNMNSGFGKITLAKTLDDSHTEHLQAIVEMRSRATRQRGEYRSAFTSPHAGSLLRSVESQLETCHTLGIVSAPWCFHLANPNYFRSSAP